MYFYIGLLVLVFVHWKPKALKVFIFKRPAMPVCDRLCQMLILRSAFKTKQFLFAEPMKSTCLVFVPGSEDSYLEAFSKNRCHTQPPSPAAEPLCKTPAGTLVQMCHAHGLLFQLHKEIPFSLFQVLSVRCFM